MNAATTDSLPFDTRVRLEAFRWFVDAGRAPSVAEVASALATAVEDVQAALRRLRDGRTVVLQSSGELLMADPFCCVPTSFVVEARERWWWAACIWDALGIPAALHCDARIRTSCGCCNEARGLEIKDSRLSGSSGIIHFAVPARDWWRNIVFT